MNTEYAPITDEDRERIREILAPMRALSPARQMILGRAIVATAKATAQALIALDALERREKAAEEKAAARRSA